MSHLHRHSCSNTRTHSYLYHTHSRISKHTNTFSPSESVWSTNSTLFSGVPLPTAPLLKEKLMVSLLGLRPCESSILSPEYWLFTPFCFSSVPIIPKSRNHSLCWFAVINLLNFYSKCREPGRLFSSRFPSFSYHIFSPVQNQCVCVSMTWKLRGNMKWRKG